MPQLDLNMFFDVVLFLNVFFVGLFVFFLLVLLPKLYFDIKLWYWKAKKFNFFFLLNNYKYIKYTVRLRKLSNDFFFF